MTEVVIRIYVSEFCVIDEFCPGREVSIRYYTIKCILKFRCPGNQPTGIGRLPGGSMGRSFIELNSSTYTKSGADKGLGIIGKPL